MIRWTPTRPAPRPQSWQSRQEILKAHLDSLTPDELRDVRPGYYWLRFGYEAWKRDHARKYDPNQPLDDHGRWVDVGRDGDANGEQEPSFEVIAARRNEAECEFRYKQDTFKCNLVRTPLCWASANERYAACLAGRAIPQLRF